MKGGGPRKHSTAEIVDTIMKHESGVSISEIARQKDMPKSLVKYHIDNAEKFLPTDIQAKKSIRISKLLRQGEYQGWRKFVQLMAFKKKDIDAMPVLDRIKAAGDIADVLNKSPFRGQDMSEGPKGIVEFTERKAHLILNNWKGKQTENHLMTVGAEPKPSAPSVETTAEVQSPPGATNDAKNP